MIVEAGDGTAGIFLTFSCCGCCNICSFMFFPFTLCSWRQICVTLQSVENVWLNDTKEKILMNVIAIYILLINKTAKKCGVCSSLIIVFSLYLFFIIVLLVISISQFLNLYCLYIHFYIDFQNEIKSWVLFWPSFGDLALFIFVFSSSFPFDYTEFPLTFHFKWKCWWVHE